MVLAAGVASRPIPVDAWRNRFGTGVRVRWVYAEGMSLEDLFLKLTGGHHAQRLDAVLDA